MRGTANPAPKFGPRETRVVDLLLEGCNNNEIAEQLKMAKRTVKAHMNRLFLRYNLNKYTGIKRVKLATTIYRERNPE